MFICPQCRCQLLRTKNEAGFYWACPQCGGSAISLAVLRKVTTPEFVHHVWDLTRRGQGVPGRPCPMCGQPMREVMPAAALNLDVCQRCDFVWLDTDELAATPPPPPPKPPRPGDEVKELSPRAREALAELEIASIKERAVGDEPDAEWKNLPALFGLPVEAESAPLAHLPWLTWTISALIALASIAAFFDLRNTVEDFGLIPSEAFRYGGLTLFTSFFIHGSIWHLVGNLYFFLIFGDNVEDYLGRKRYLLLLLASLLLGDFLHIAGDPHSLTPCIGASGGISGVIAFYALKFPHARLGFRLRYGLWLGGWFQFSAWGAFCLWIALQLFGAYEQIAGFSNVSALAHLGGSACGFFAWLVWRNLDAKPDVAA